MLITGNKNTRSLESPNEDMDSAAKGASRITVKTISDSAALAGLEVEWRDLCRRAAEHGFFQTYTWVWAWWKYLGEPSGYGLRIITVKQDGRLVLIWPLVVNKQLLWRVGTWPGAGTGQYGDLLIEAGSDRADWLEVAWRAIEDDCNIDVLYLEGIQENAIVQSFLAGDTGRLKPVASSPRVNIREFQDWETFHAGLKRSFRQNIHRTRRRLKEKGQLIHRVIEDPAEIEQVVAKSIKLKLGRLKQRSIYGRLLGRPEAEQWLDQLTQSTQQDGVLMITTLSLDETILATQIGFLYRRHFYCYFGAFDIAYSTFQPGKLEPAGTLKWAFENDVDTFDLMPPADDYKLYWARPEAAVQIFIGHITAWGRIAKPLYNNNLRNNAIGFYPYLARGFRRFVVRLVANSNLSMDGLRLICPL